MKKLSDIVVIRKERDISQAKRRDDYALRRDLLAAEYNDAISRRQILEEEDRERCIKCGKVFVSEIASKDNKKCPDCR